MSSSTNQQRFVKNNDTPPQDSPLWLVGDAWKRSQKTKIDYQPIGSIIDDELLMAARQQSRLDVKERDYIHKPIEVEYDDGTIDNIDYWYFVTDFNGNGKFSIFAFDNEDGARKKKEEAVRFAGYDSSGGGNQQGQGQQTLNKPVSAPRTTTTTTSTSAPLKTIQQQPEGIHTFVDPQPVSFDNQEQIATLLQDGYNFLPASIVNPNTWETLEYDKTGKVIGKSVIFLMGKIINVKAEPLDNNGE